MATLPEVSILPIPNRRECCTSRQNSGQGLDVVVVASFNDGPFFGYQLGFPRTGRWAELFNSDVYDNCVNPLVVGNNGAIYASGGPLHNLPFSAAITIPPRAILVFGIS